MKYFYDTEFLDEGTGKPITLISIAFVAEDGRELYLINQDFDWDNCTHAWLHEHVRPFVDVTFKDPEAQRIPLNEMASKILAFVGEEPELWAYFGAYDHVMLSHIFGTMMQLPSKHWMHTMDLKQEMKYRNVPKSSLPTQTTNLHRALDDARWNKLSFESLCGQRPV